MGDCIEMSNSQSMCIVYSETLNYSEPDLEDQEDNWVYINFDFVFEGSWMHKNRECFHLA